MSNISFPKVCFISSLNIASNYTPYQVKESESLFTLLAQHRLDTLECLSPATFISTVG